MKNISLLFAAGLILTACVEDTGTSSMGPSFTGASNDNSGNLVSASVRPRSGGSTLLVLSRTGGVSCTAVYEELASAGNTELAQLKCTDGNNGTATLVYDTNAEPSRVVYAAGTASAGTINLS